MTQLYIRKFSMIPMDNGRIAVEICFINTLVKERKQQIEREREREVKKGEFRRVLISRLRPWNRKRV